MKPSGKGGAALTADRRVPDPDLCGPHCFQMPDQGDQTGKDWPCHTLSLPQFQVVGGTLYQLPGRGPCAHLPGSKAGSTVRPARLEKWGEGDVCAEGRQARPGGSNEACEGHRGGLGVRVMGGQARGGPGVMAAAVAVISPLPAVAGMIKHAPCPPAVVTLSRS